MRSDAPVDAATVVRFLVERRARPTLALMRELAPDPGNVQGVLLAFDRADPAPRLRERADAETAARVACDDASAAAWPPEALRAVLAPVVAAAVAACWSARDAGAASVEARRALALAQTTREGWIHSRRMRAETLGRTWATLLLAAHARVAEAEGVARAVSFAERGERWAPAPPPPGSAATAPATEVSRAADGTGTEVTRTEARPVVLYVDVGQVEPKGAA